MHAPGACVDERHGDKCIYMLPKRMNFQIPYPSAVPGIVLVQTLAAQAHVNQAVAVAYVQYSEHDTQGLEM